MVSTSPPSNPRELRVDSSQRSTARVAHSWKGEPQEGSNYDIQWQGSGDNTPMASSGPLRLCPQNDGCVTLRGSMPVVGRGGDSGPQDSHHHSDC